MTVHILRTMSFRIHLETFVSKTTLQNIILSQNYLYTTMIYLPTLPTMSYINGTKPFVCSQQFTTIWQYQVTPWAHSLIASLLQLHFFIYIPILMQHYTQEVKLDKDVHTYVTRCAIKNVVK